MSTSSASLPVPFQDVADQLPDSARPVLAIRRSATSKATHEVLTAVYDPQYRPNNPWRDIGNDAVTDSGNPVLGWCDPADLATVDWAAAGTDWFGA